MRFSWSSFVVIFVLCDKSHAFLKRELINDPKLNVLLNVQDQLNDDLPHPSPVTDKETTTSKKTEEIKNLNPKSNRFTDSFYQLLHLPNPLPPYVVVPGFLVGSPAKARSKNLPGSASLRSFIPVDFDVNQTKSETSKQKRYQTDWMLESATETDLDQHALDVQEELAQDEVRKQQTEAVAQKSKRLGLELPTENENNFDESKLEESKRKKRDARDVSPSQPRFLLERVYNGMFGKSNQTCEVGVISRILKFMASKVPTFVDSIVFGKLSEFARTSCAPPPVLGSDGLPVQQFNKIREPYDADKAFHVKYYKPQQ